MRATAHGGEGDRLDHKGWSRGFFAGTKDRVDSPVDTTGFRPPTR